MKVSYDPIKNAKNIEKHGLSFDRVPDFGLDAAVIQIDNRRDYGEVRLRAYGPLDGHMHALVYVRIAADEIRCISLRRANKREVKRYGR